MRKVAFEISNNSIQVSSSYAGPSVVKEVDYQYEKFANISLNNTIGCWFVKILLIFNDRTQTNN